MPFILLYLGLLELPNQELDIHVLIGNCEVIIPIKVLSKIPFLLLLFLYSNSYRLFLPTIKPYYVNHKIDGFLELIKYISEPDSYKFPNDYSILIETIILFDYFCYPTFIRFTEKQLQVPLGSIEPANIGYQKLQQIIRGSYRVYNDHFVEYQKSFYGKCTARIFLPDPTERIFRSTCCNANLCKKCAVQNV